jgi:putative aldouronate transport system substrate-binding protein
MHMALKTPRGIWTHDMIRARLNRRGLVKGAVAGGAGLAYGAGFARPIFAQTPVPPMIDPTADEPPAELPLSEETATLRILQVQSPFVEDYETNDFTLWLEEQTNVHIEWQTVPYEEREAALNLRLASGDYPEIIMDFNPTPSVIQLYGSQGIFMPLNDLIEQHGVMTNVHWETTPAARVASTAPDGNIYSLPSINDCYHCTMSAKLWINHEWLETLGLEMPQTTEEYAEVLRAFKDGDPNGNGEADEVPLSGSTQAWHGTPDEFFMGSFIYHPGNKLRLIQDAGTVTAIYAQEAWREGTKYLAGLAAEELLSPEIFTNDRDQIRALGNGRDGTMVLGSCPAGWFGEFMTFTAGQSGPWDAYTAVSPLEGPDGTRLSMHDTFQAPIIGTFIITDKCENPELAMKWADYLGRIEPTTRSIHGVKDEDWRWAYEGEVGIDGEQAWWHSITDIANVPSQNVHWSQDGPSVRTAKYRLSQVVPDPDDITAGANLEVVLYNLTRDMYEPYTPAEPMNLPPMYFTEDQANEVATILPQLETFVDETFAQALTGQIDIEAEWESYLSNLEAIGLSRFVEIHQEVLDQVNANA